MNSRGAAVVRPDSRHPAVGDDQPGRRAAAPDHPAAALDGELEGGDVRLRPGDDVVHPGGAVRRLRAGAVKRQPVPAEPLERLGRPFQEEAAEGVVVAGLEGRRSEPAGVLGMGLCVIDHSRPLLEARAGGGERADRDPGRPAGLRQLLQHEDRPAGLGRGQGRGQPASPRPDNHHVEDRPHGTVLRVAGSYHRIVSIVPDSSAARSSTEKISPIAPPRSSRPLLAGRSK